MKSLAPKLIALATAALLFAGCSAGTKTAPPQPNQAQKEAPSSQEEDHVSMVKGNITYSVSKKIKYFEQNMIPSGAGNTVAGLLVTIANNSPDAFEIDPAAVTITTEDGKKHIFSPDKTAITGKGGFSKHQLNPGFTGGGLVLFVIKNTDKVTSLEYDDKKGHAFSYNFIDGVSKI